MKRDSLFFRFFQELPSSFFQMIGRADTDPLRYELNAIEYKETSVRLDGLFLPRDPRIDPAYIWEAQYYASDKVYANLLSKVGRFLEHGNSSQDWVAVVIYPKRSMEQKNLRPYRCLLQSDQLVRIYLDELPPAAPDQFEMGILELIAAKPEVALEKAQVMVPRLRSSNRSNAFQRQVVQFLETIILYQFPQMSRKEIEKMLQVTDVRETRVFQEALEEGEEKGRREALEAVILGMLDADRPVAEIAKITGLSAARIRAIKKKRSAE